MSEHLQDLLTQVLALPKASVSSCSVRFSRASTPEDVEAAWSTEIRRRLEELRAGKADVVEWADARTAIHGSGQ